VSDVRPTLLPALDVIVAVRSLADGKERLGPALDAEERETLILGMLLNTLEVLGAAPAVRRVHVVSRDPTVLTLAGERAASAIAEPAGGELNAALSAGRDAALVDGGGAVLYLPADLPMLGAESVARLVDAADAALAAGGGRPLVVIAPSDVGGGTNALLVAPPTVVDPSFGLRSFEAHARAAQAADATVQVVVDPVLGFDLDTPDDLERLDASRLVALIERGTQVLVAGESA
jgi:2-phospho-L-lactate/phosphoenolpyruvate guanylyltransferase